MYYLQVLIVPIIILYLLMSIDYPTRIGRNKYITYKGLKNFLYTVYSGLYFLLVLVLTLLIGMNLMEVASELGGFLLFITVLLVAGGFLALNVSMVMNRSELTAVMYETNENEFDIE
ncbi:hypothetical protein PQ478_19430 [Alkalihalophilus pseudofirmus]|uniref:hypothetical protein n=1 Tax=Alkalihalophilus pseudofirmus TaxID=79885 RepID=UPI00259BB4A3|nr:hypothetical protein [Alkalihalophilus pseudofirmus]WEG16651.1 hypothetical protein PQ478_19430 [Alkalihalophilus pseudofirmus]